MRIPLIFIAAAALSACGLGGVSTSATHLKTALAAYQKGDLTALEAEVAKADAEADGARGLADLDTSCSAEAAGARRTILVASELHELDRPPVFSMSDDARFLYLASVMGGSGVNGPYSGVPDNCVKDNAATTGADAFERARLIKEFATSVRAWRGELRTQSPDDFNRRMEAAAGVLRANGVGHVHWIGGEES